MPILVQVTGLDLLVKTTREDERGDKIDGLTGTMNVILKDDKSTIFELDVPIDNVPNHLEAKFRALFSAIETIDTFKQACNKELAELKA